MGHNPAELNRLCSAATQAAMEEKLSRELTQDESDKIWNTGSFLQLEQINMAIHFARSVEELESYLAALPNREPLPEEYTRRET